LDIGLSMAGMSKTGLGFTQAIGEFVKLALEVGGV
jgi:hypothetical protein